MEQAKVSVRSSSGIALVNRPPSAARPIESNQVLFIHFCCNKAASVSVFVLETVSFLPPCFFHLRKCRFWCMVIHCVGMQQYKFLGMPGDSRRVLTIAITF